MTDVERGTLTAVIMAILAALCLGPLVMIEHSQCANPGTEKIGNMPIWGSCGTTRERKAVNDDSP